MEERGLREARQRRNNEKKRKMEEGGLREAKEWRNNEK